MGLQGFKHGLMWNCRHSGRQVSPWNSFRVTLAQHFMAEKKGDLTDIVASLYDLGPSGPAVLKRVGPDRHRRLIIGTWSYGPAVLKRAGPDRHRHLTIGPWSYGPAVLKRVGPDRHRRLTIGPWSYGPAVLKRCDLHGQS